MFQYYTRKVFLFKEVDPNNENIGKNTIFIFLLQNCYCIFSIFLNINLKKGSPLYFDDWRYDNIIMTFKSYHDVKILEINYSSIIGQLYTISFWSNNPGTKFILKIECCSRFFYSFALVKVIFLVGNPIAQLYQLCECHSYLRAPVIWVSQLSVVWVSQQSEYFSCQLSECPS